MIERKLRSVVNWQVAVKQGLMYTHAGIHSFFFKCTSHKFITKLNFYLLSQYLGPETHTSALAVRCMRTDTHSCKGRNSNSTFVHEQ